MKEKTLNKLRELDAKLEQLHVDLSIFNSDELNLRPQPGAWSALDNIQHLKLSEEMSLQYLQKKLSGGLDGLSRAGLKTKMRVIALNTFMRSNRKRKAPKVVDESSFPERSDLSEVMDEWRANRRALREFLAQQPDELFALEAYRHPAAGRMTILGMMQFFEAHFDRHRKQIRRTLGEEY